MAHPRISASRRCDARNASLLLAATQRNPALHGYRSLDAAKARFACILVGMPTRAHCCSEETPSRYASRADVRPTFATRHVERAAHAPRVARRTRHATDIRPLWACMQAQSHGSVGRYYFLESHRFALFWEDFLLNSDK